MVSSLTHLTGNVFQKTFWMSEYKVRHLPKLSRSFYKISAGQLSCSRDNSQKLKALHRGEEGYSFCQQCNLKTTFGTEAGEKIKSIPLSYDTIHRHTCDMSSNIQIAVISSAKHSNRLAMQVDESSVFIWKARLSAFI